MTPLEIVLALVIVALLIANGNERVRSARLETTLANMLAARDELTKMVAERTQSQNATAQDERAFPAAKGRFDA